MKMKKILSIALALVLAIGMLAGCNGGGAGSMTSADISAFVDTDETLSLSWLSYATLAGCEEGLASELLLEDKFNVDIKPIFAEYGSYNDKKNSLLQSDEIPDLIYESDPGFLFADARDEYLLEVPYAAIQKYAPTLFADLTEKAPAAWAYSYYEGANYGLPNTNHAQVVNQVPGFRGDWLEAVSMKAPTTLDELHDVLYAFAHNDPDGNGIDDTFGYVPYTNHYQHFFGEIFGAYGILPFDWQEADGEIVYGGLRPETEEVLQILADWYKEGIIYPAFVEMPDNGIGLFQKSQAGYLQNSGYVDPALATSNIALAKAIDPDATLVNSTLVKGPEGKVGMRSWGYPCHIVAFGNNGEDAPKKATRILKMLDGMRTDDELLKEVRFGKEGETYEMLDKASTTSATAYKPTPAYENAAQQRLAGYEFNTSGPTFWSPIAPSKEFYDSFFTDASLTFREKYAEPVTVLTDVFYKVDIVPSAPTYIDDLRNGQMALMAQVIKGEKSADQYIEEFTKIWDSTGGPQLIAEAQAQGDILEEIYSQIGIEK